MKITAFMDKNSITKQVTRNQPMEYLIKITKRKQVHGIISIHMLDNSNFKQVINNCFVNLKEINLIVVFDR